MKKTILALVALSLFLGCSAKPKKIIPKTYDSSKIEQKANKEWSSM